MSFKEKCDKMTSFIESCFDENNPNDGLTFDERLNKRLNEDNEAKEFFDKYNIDEW